MSGRDAEGLDRLCACLADGTRRRIYEELGRRPGLTTADVAAFEPRISRWAVMKHLAVMRDAGLVQTLPEGRRRRHFRDPRALSVLSGWLSKVGSG